MCGVCGVLGGAMHWSSAQGRLTSTASTTPRAERMRGVGLLNRIAAARGVKVSDWHGSAYLVAGPTGGQEVVESLDQVWAALDRLGGRPVDPLAFEWTGLHPAASSKRGD